MAIRDGAKVKAPPSVRLIITPETVAERRKEWLKHAAKTAEEAAVRCYGGRKRPKWYGGVQSV